MSADQPATLKFGRSQIGSPRTPLRSRQRKVLRQIVERLFNGMSLIGIRWRRRARRLRESIEPLKGNYRKKPDVHVTQQVPLFLRTSLRKHAAQTVAYHTRSSQAFIGQLFVDHSLFSLVESRSRFLGRKAVIVAQVLHDLLRLIGRDRQAVQSNHSLDYLLPALGSRALVGYSSKTALLVFLVTRDAAVDDELAGDGNAFFDCLFRFVVQRWRSLRRLRLRLRSNGERENERCEQECCDNDSLNSLHRRPRFNGRLPPSIKKNGEGKLLMMGTRWKSQST